MNASSQPTQASAQRHAPDAMLEAATSWDDEDVAIGCECANPALQIETWGTEPAAQPYRTLY